jgi:ATP adenylyltransferase
MPPSSPEPDVEDQQDFAHAVDGFERLWTPHRMVYIKGDSRPSHDGPGLECPFCRAPNGSDEDGLVVHRGELVYAVLNLFPYNPGHLLICPYEHLADYTELTSAQRAELGEVTVAAMRVIRAVSGAHGFNLGMNQGSVGGAGIAGHLHQHVVPRWNGDSNFLPIIAGTKALPELLADTRAKIARGWRELNDDAAGRRTGEGAR